MSFLSRWRTDDVTDAVSVLVPQMIQRQLQQVEERQRQLEETGVMVEKALRGEAGKTTHR